MAKETNTMSYQEAGRASVIASILRRQLIQVEAASQFSRGSARRIRRKRW